MITIECDSLSMLKNVSYLFIFVFLQDLDHCCGPEERTDWDSLELSYFNCPFLESVMVVCSMGLKADIHYPVMLLLKNARSMRKLSFSEYK